MPSWAQVSKRTLFSPCLRRDAGLAMPQLMLPAAQVNMRAGRLPPAQASGTRHFKITLDAI